MQVPRSGVMAAGPRDVIRERLVDQRPIAIRHRCRHICGEQANVSINLESLRPDCSSSPFTLALDPVLNPQ